MMRTKDETLEKLQGLAVDSQVSTEEGESQHGSTDQEKWCARVLKEYLESQNRIVSFERGEPDPPDFWFSVDDETWAVEHTRLLMATGPARGNTERQAKSFVSQIESLVRSKMVFPQDYPESWAVEVFGSIPGESISEIANRVMKTISGTELPAMRKRVSIFEIRQPPDFYGSVVIERYPRDRDPLQFLSAPTVINPDDHVIADVILRKALDRKRRFRLESVSRRCNARTVLLFDGEAYGAYHSNISSAMINIASMEPNLIAGLDYAFLFCRFQRPGDPHISCVFG